MNFSFRKLFILAAFIACGSVANAQLPNEKFGKPSNLEWDFNGWGEAVGADAIILCKTMNATYQLSDQVENYNRTDIEVNWDNVLDFGKNELDESNILVKYEIGLRMKILKPEGAKHANIDITYFNADDDKVFYHDDIEDLKIKVFSKNEKGKVVTKKVDTSKFAKERVDKNYMVMHVVVPDVQAGSIIEYQYKITSIRPSYLYDWVFQESIPTVRSKCDLQVPAFLQFNMNVPINKLIKANVEVSHIAYDMNRADLKKPKTCTTNHYTIVGDYILPQGMALKPSPNKDGKEEAEEIAIFTSQLVKPEVTLPATMPAGSTHLRVK